MLGDVKLPLLISYIPSKVHENSSDNDGIFIELPGVKFSSNNDSSPSHTDSAVISTLGKQ